MIFGKQYKEVYIRLVEDEPALIYTVRYGGIFGISTRLPLEGGGEVLPEDQPKQLVRTERRLRATGQGD